MKTALVKMTFIVCLAAGLMMALPANRHGALHMFLPESLRRWVNEHDDAANVMAFFILAAVALRLPCAQAKGGTTLPAVILQRLVHPLARVAALMLFVCAIEFTQSFIPGRVSELQDVCTGWSGIFAAWLISVLLDVRVIKSPARAPGGN